MSLDPAIVEARRLAEPYRMLRQAVGDVRLVGGLFVLLGLLPMLFVAFTAVRGGTRGARILSIVNTVVLLGPGIWYFAAGTMMRRLSRPALRQAVWVARAQLVLVPSAMVLGFLARAGAYEPHLFIIPAALTLFFVPALIALMFTFRRIDGLMNNIAPEIRGFEALPVQALSIAGDAAVPPPPLPLQISTASQPPPLPQQGLR
jgi:hypothetical protein